MGTAKRERQKQLRQAKIEELRKQERRDDVRKRGLLIGGAVVAFLVFAIVFSILTRDDEADTATTDTSTAEPSGDDAPGDDASDDAAPDDAATVPTTPVGEPVEPECPPADGSGERQLDFTGPFPNCLTDGVDYQARFVTSEGDVLVDLREDEMPNTVSNFVALSRWHYYDDTLLFRTDPSIDIIQGGSPHTEDNSDPGPGYTITDEGGEFSTDAAGQYVGPFTYEEGQLIMARSAGPDSSSAQFFFSTGPNVAKLDSQGTYLLFGDVVEGLDVLQAIIGLHEEDPASGLGGGPSREVVIDEVEIVED